MKIEFNRDALNNALKIVGGMVKSNHTRTELRGIQLAPAGEDLDLVATDLEVGVRHRIVPDSITDPQAVVLPAAILIGIVREVTDETISLTVEKGKQATIKAGRSRFRLELIDADLYPDVPGFPDTGEEIYSDMLNTMIERTLFAVSNEEGRYAINALHVKIKADSIIMAATDGRRLSVAKQKRSGGDIEPSLLIPKKALRELQKRLANYEGQVKIAYLNNQILFQVEDTTYVSRQVEGSFPSYEDVIPKDASLKIKLDRDELMIKLRQAQLLMDIEQRRVKFNFKPLMLLLETETSGRGEAKIEMATDYENEFMIAFNPEFVIDILRVLDSTEVVFEFKTDAHPGMIRDGENYLHIVMPLTVSG